tara:strand:- start:1985 stop:2209 length:225 start_codon:yes stop_codon:yes gene_type:complete
MSDGKVAATIKFDEDEVSRIIAALKIVRNVQQAFDGVNLDKVISELEGISKDMKEYKEKQKKGGLKFEFTDKKK